MSEFESQLPIPSSAESVRHLESSFRSYRPVVQPASTSNLFLILSVIHHCLWNKHTPDKVNFDFRPLPVMFHFLPRGFVSPALFPSMFAPHLRPPSCLSRGCSAKFCFESYQHGVSDQAQTALSGTFLFWYRLAKLYLDFAYRMWCRCKARLYVTISQAKHVYISRRYFYRD